MEDNIFENSETRNGDVESEKILINPKKLDKKRKNNFLDYSELKDADFFYPNFENLDNADHDANAGSGDDNNADHDVNAGSGDDDDNNADHDANDGSGDHDDDNTAQHGYNASDQNNFDSSQNVPANTTNGFNAMNAQIPNNTQNYNGHTTTGPPRYNKVPSSMSDKKPKKLNLTTTSDVGDKTKADSLERKVCLTKTPSERNNNLMLKAPLGDLFAIFKKTHGNGNGNPQRQVVLIPAIVQMDDEEKADKTKKSEPNLPKLKTSRPEGLFLQNCFACNGLAVKLCSRRR